MERSEHRIADFHSHILPEIDDGSRSLEMSVSMLRMEAEQGIGKISKTEGVLHVFRFSFLKSSQSLNCVSKHRMV